MSDSMQTEGDQLYAKKLISNISAGSGSLVATSIAEGPVAASTPPRGRECRRAKRLREQSAESEWIDHDTPVSALGSSQHLNWVKPLAGYIVTWLNSFCEHHSLCRAIPREVVVRLTIAIYRLHLAKAAKRCAKEMKASAAASFWIAIKFAAARHTMPNATFTSYVTDVDKQMLLAAELEVLQNLSWDVYGVARAANLAPPREP